MQTATVYVWLRERWESTAAGAHYFSRGRGHGLSLWSMVWHTGVQNVKFHSDALGCRVSVTPRSTVPCVAGVASRARPRGAWGSPAGRRPDPGPAGRPVRCDMGAWAGPRARGDRGPDVSGPTVVLAVSPETFTWILQTETPPHAAHPAASMEIGVCRRCPVEPRETRACAVRRVTVTRVARPTVCGCAGCVRTARVRARCSRHRAAPRSRSHPPMTANTLATESLHQTNAFCDGIL